MAAASGVPQFASLYVGDLHPDVTEAMLYEIFNSVGPVASIRICRDSVSRRSLGYGYVNFHSVSDAERALDTLNYSSIKGRSCRIMWSQRDPSLRKSGAGNIYVKNLDKNIDNKALYDTFSLFGNILSCKVASDPFGASYGYGFVHYETEEAAKQAIERVNGMQIGEKTVQVCQFMKRDARDTGDKENYTNLYVKNMKPEWEDDEKLTAVFSKYGAVQSAALRSDPKGRKFAFVNFELPEDAKKCVAELHLTDIRTPEEIEKAKAEGKEEDEAGPDGHPINKLYVQRAQSKQERAAELKAKFTGSGGADVGVNLYVKNLDENIDDASLKELFEPYGNVTSVAVKKDDKGKCKGFGFVCFASPDEATKAVTEMHLKVIKGKPLYVGLAERRETRQERLRQRYQTGGAAGGKGAGGGNMQGGGILSNLGGMAPPMMGKGGPLMGAGGPMMGAPMGMMGKGGPMMGMVGPRGPMMAPQMMMGMMGKGPMMGKGGPMMGPMAMNPMAMMRPMMMPQQMMRPVAPAQAATGAGLNAAALAAAPPAVQKQMIGEKLYPAIAKFQPELAGKITGMMLEMDNSELLLLLESDQQLKHKVDEALRVLQGRQ
jgi:polyadenylate-binding protein